LVCVEKGCLHSGHFPLGQLFNDLLEFSTLHRQKMYGLQVLQYCGSGYVTEMILSGTKDITDFNPDP
jgi:hypothetical protein